MKRLLCNLLLAALMAVAYAPPALAQPSEANRATARKLAEQGYDALVAKDYAKAAELFERAEGLYHAPTVLLGLARAQVELGRFVEAQENYQRIIHEKLPANANDAFRDAQTSARSEVVGLKDRIAWLVIRVEGASEPIVEVDGVDVPPAALGVERAVNPGPHVVRGHAPGFLQEEQKVAVQSGETKEVVLTLEASDEPVPKPPSDGPVGVAGPTTPPSDTADPGATQRTLGWVSLGLGGAGLVLGTITGILAMDHHGELTDNCPNEQCPMEQESTLDSYETTSTLSTVGFIAGGVLAATGVILVLAAPSAEDEGSSADQPTVSARVGPGSVQAIVKF